MTEGGSTFCQAAFVTSAGWLHDCRGQRADLREDRLPENGVGQSGLLQKSTREDLSRQVFASEVALPQVEDLVRDSIRLQCTYSASVCSAKQFLSVQMLLKATSMFEVIEI